MNGTSGTLNDKLNSSSVVNDVTTGGTNVPLSAQQGVVLKGLIDSIMKFRGVKFISSSLFLAYDASNPVTCCLKLIDFDKYEQEEGLAEDTNILKGLENVSSFL